MNRKARIAPGLLLWLFLLFFALARGFFVAFGLLVCAEVFAFVVAGGGSGRVVFREIGGLGDACVVALGHCFLPRVVRVCLRVLGLSVVL